MKFWEYLDELSIHWLLEKGSATWSWLDTSRIEGVLHILFL
jgi:hypothetical protein